MDIYKLRLPLKSRSHLVFYIGILKPTLYNTPLIIKEVDQKGDGEYEVEEILDSEE